MNSLKKLLLFIAALGMAPSSAFSQAPAVPVSPAAPATLWSFLGIPQGVKKVQGALTNRRGNLPRLEPKDAMRALNDPRNLFSSDKAIKKAAELKIQEDLKPQKIKALKYLTSIGCGCYDKGGEVTDALIAAAEDCTEDVRLTVMQQIKEAAQNKCCNNCGQVCCCSEKMLKKLAEVAYERDEAGCYKEPSARVRQAAAEALRTCLPNSEPPCIAPEEPKTDEDLQKEAEPKPLKEGKTEPADQPLREGKSRDTLEEIDADKELGAGNTRQPLEPIRMKLQQKLTDDVTSGIDGQRSSRRRFQSEYHQVGSQFSSQASVTLPEHEAGLALEHAYHPEINLDSDKLADNEGVVISFDDATQIAHVHFSNRQVDLQIGDEIAFQDDPTATNLISGKWRIVYAQNGCIRMVAVDQQRSLAVMAGQHMMLSMPSP